MRFGILGNQGFTLSNFRGPLLRDIVTRGHDVFALAPEISSEDKFALQRLGVQTINISLRRAGLNPFRDVADVAKLFLTLRALELDVILSYSIKPVVYGTVAARLAGVQRRYALIAGLGYTFSDNAKSSLSSAAVHYAARSLYQFGLGHARKVFMQNTDDADEFVSLGILPREKIVLVNGTGVDLEDWRQLPIPNHHPTFVLAARLLAEKGVREYISAAKRVKASHPTVRFVLLGGLDPNPNGILRQEVEQWVSDGVIEWPGHVPVRQWLALSSVFVLPSYYREGVPRSIQEAMATGRPIITTSSPGCRETVIDGYNGFIVPPRDPVALADAMLKYVSNPCLISKMGQASRSLVEKRFDVRVINEQMISAMEL